MGWLKFTMLALSLWGITASAHIGDAFGGEHQELQTISSWTAHLNRYFPGLRVAISSDLSDAFVRRQVLHELELLENHLQGVIVLPHQFLTIIACRNIICGGD